MRNDPWSDQNLAADGRPICENFLGWFGKSKAVDKSGSPLQLYHGTRSEFDSFDARFCNQNTKTGVPDSTFVFSSSAAAAASYAGQRTPTVDKTLPTEDLYNEWLDLLKKHGPTGPARAFHLLHEVPNLPTYVDGGHVIPVYLSIQKPLKVNAKNGSWREIPFKGEDLDSNEIMSYAKEHGYDGVIIRNVHDRQEGKGPAADTYAVFSASQIKSTLNNGLFLPRSASLTDFDASQKLMRAFRARSVASSNFGIENNRKRVGNSLLT